MFLYFISALLISLALIKLGSYATIIAMISTGTKVMVGAFVVIAFVILYRKLRGKPCIIKQQQLPKI